MGKSFNTRIQQKIDTAENWAKAINFTPLKNELIIYDKDEDYDYYRFKIGDGITNVNNLSFADWGTVDWDQNNVNSNEYIKNRTHWREKVGETTTLFSETFTTTNLIYSKPTPLDIITGDIISVNWDGTIYTCTALSRNINEIEMIVFGNPGIFDETPNDIPFVVVADYTTDGEYFSYGGMTIVYVGGEDDISHTVVITKTKEYEYHKLDNNYLNIENKLDKNSENIISSKAIYSFFSATRPDYDQNDSDSLNYIKNRPFFFNPAFKKISWNDKIATPAVSTTIGNTTLNYYQVVNREAEYRGNFSEAILITQQFDSENNSYNNPSKKINYENIIYLNPDNSNSYTWGLEYATGVYPLVSISEENINTSFSIDATSTLGSSYTLSFPQTGLYVLEIKNITENIDMHFYNVSTEAGYTKKIDKKFLPETEEVQVDQNENSPESKAYIKNRTHWKEEPEDGTTTYYDNAALAVDGEGLYSDSTSLNISSGDTVFVDWDGTTYTCIATSIYVEPITGIVLGNPSAFSESYTATDEPFCIIVNYDLINADGDTVPAGKTIVDLAKNGNSHSVKIYKGTTYHKLDNNYLNIDKQITKNSVNLITSGSVYDNNADWRKNESGSTFIKGRTHWTQNQQFETISWNGDTTDLLKVDVSNGGESLPYYYKVIDLPEDFTSQMVKNCSIKGISKTINTSDSAQNHTTITSKTLTNEDIFYNDKAIMIDIFSIMFILNDNTTLDGNETWTDLNGTEKDMGIACTFSKKGVYFQKYDIPIGSVNLSSCAYELSLSGETFPLYEQYIPDTIARTSAIPANEKLLPSVISTNDKDKILIVDQYDRWQVSSETLYDLILQKFADRLLPDPTQVEDGLTLVVKNGKWVTATSSASNATSVNGISIQVANEAPSEVDENNPTITFVV